eukprot:1391864-Amorphochlora_amoeboformis.AAC.2
MFQLSFNTSRWQESKRRELINSKNILSSSFRTPEEVRQPGDTNRKIDLISITRSTVRVGIPHTDGLYSQVPPEICCVFGFAGRSMVTLTCCLKNSQNSQVSFGGRLAALES